jgi:BTB/POZ domain
MASHENDDLPHKSINDAQLMYMCHPSPTKGSANQASHLRLLYSEKAERYTDAKVTCKGIEWKVHQLVLCSRCPFFEKCFRDATFKVRTLQARSKSTLNLNVLPVHIFCPSVVGPKCVADMFRRAKTRLLTSRMMSPMLSRHCSSICTRSSIPAGSRTTSNSLLQ